jgi:hypothetical protein
MRDKLGAELVGPDEGFGTMHGDFAFVPTAVGWSPLLLPL